MDAEIFFAKHVDGFRTFLVTALHQGCSGAALNQVARGGLEGVGRSRRFCQTEQDLRFERVRGRDRACEQLCVGLARRLGAALEEGSTARCGEDRIHHRGKPRLGEKPGDGPRHRVRSDHPALYCAVGLFVLVTAA